MQIRFKLTDWCESDKLTARAKLYLLANAEVVSALDNLDYYPTTLPAGFTAVHENNRYSDFELDGKKIGANGLLMIRLYDKAASRGLTTILSDGPVPYFYFLPRHITTEDSLHVHPHKEIELAAPDQLEELFEEVLKTISGTNATPEAKQTLARCTSDLASVKGKLADGDIARLTEAISQKDLASAMALANTTKGAVTRALAGAIQAFLASTLPLADLVKLFPKFDSPSRLCSVIASIGRMDLPYIPSKNETFYDKDKQPIPLKKLSELKDETVVAIRDFKPAPKDVEAFLSGELMVLAYVDEVYVRRGSREKAEYRERNLAKCKVEDFKLFWEAAQKGYKEGGDLVIEPEAACYSGGVTPRSGDEATELIDLDAI